VTRRNLRFKARSYPGTACPPGAKRRAGEKLKGGAQKSAAPVRRGD